MSAIKTVMPGIHQFTLRSSNYERSKQSYNEMLGFDIILEKPNLFIFFAGSTTVAIRGPVDQTPKGQTFNPFTVGLDHVALGCEYRQELVRVARAPEDAGIKNTGIKVDDKWVKSMSPLRIPT